nr:integrase, catalytic region, zinc finger, CCHC-type, peptidase aspartic, catalytic [Tanacetum cinerariifolium]
MLLEGSELTKDERESQLYDEFEYFYQNKGETIHEYYVKGRQNRCQGNYDRGAVAAVNGGVQNRVGNVNSGQAKQINCYNCNRIGHIARNYTQPKRPRNSEYFKDKMLLMQAQENGAVLDEEKLLFIASGQTNTFDDDVDEAPAPTAQTMFMANLSSTNPIYDEAGPSYHSNILSEVQDHDNYVDSVGEYHDVHEMQNDVQPNYVVDSYAKYTSDSNIIPYEHVMNDGNTVSKFAKIHEAYTVAQARCVELEAELSKLKHKIQKDDHSEMIKRFSNLEIDHNKKELFRAENANIEQHYKELYDSIKITCAKIITTATALLAKNENLKAQIKRKIKYVTIDYVKPKVLAPSIYAIDVEPIPPRNRNNKEVHIAYLKHHKESVETLCEIVEEARVEKPLDSSLASTCLYTKKSKELVEYVIGTCPKYFNKRDKKIATAPLTRKKQVTFKETSRTLNDNMQKHVEPRKEKKSNVHVIPSLGVFSSTEASRSKPRRNTKNTRILPARSDNKKKVEDYPRETIVNVGYQWKSTGRKFTLGEQCSLTKFTESKVVPLQQPNHIVLWYLDSGYSKHMTGNRSWLKNFVKKFIGTVRFGNDHFGAIIGYEDYVIGDSVISRVYYVEGLEHSLFSVGKFCDSDLEVAFRKHSCYVRNEDGVELVKEPPSVRRPTPPASVVQVPVVSVEPSFDESSSEDVSSAESTQVIKPHNHLGKWSKDHPLDNVIDYPSHLVSTRKKLATDALWSLYNFVLSKVETKNFKTAMDKACWFKAMQEEIHKFDRL